MALHRCAAALIRVGMLSAPILAAAGEVSKAPRPVTAPALVATLIMPYRARLPRSRLVQSCPEPGLHCLTVDGGSNRDALYVDLRGSGRAWLERTSKAGAISNVQLTGDSHAT